MEIFYKYLILLKKAWNFRKPRQQFILKYVMNDSNNKIICYLIPQKDLVLGNHIWYAANMTNKVRFKGVASYKEGDKYSIQEGKEIARKKALRQYWKNIFNWSKQIMDINLRSIGVTEQFMACCSDNIRQITNEILEKTKE